MGLVKSKSSRHMDEPPKYEKTSSNNNPYNLNETITAATAHAKVTKIYEERYKSVIKYNLKEIYKYIGKYTIEGKTQLEYVPCPRDYINQANSRVLLNLSNKQKESDLYKKMCDEICDILRKDGYDVELKTANEPYIYGIPRYSNHNAFFIKW
jgi:hypothetical protein